MALMRFKLFRIEDESFTKFLYCAIDRRSCFQILQGLKSPDHSTIQLVHLIGVRRQFNKHYQFKIGKMAGNIKLLVIFVVNFACCKGFRLEKVKSS
jgi:hypothetical protein